MPYISQEKRHVLDPVIDQLHTELVNLELDDPNNNMEGNLNYVITRLLRMTYDLSYRNINDSIGMLMCVAFEHYRTQAGPYEDFKRVENGDVEIQLKPEILEEMVVEKPEE